MNNPFEKLFDGIEPPTGSVDCGKTEGRGAAEPSPDDLEFFEQALRALGKSARIRGHRDYALGIEVIEGMNAFERDGASKAELEIYGAAYSRSMLKDIIGKSDLDVEEVQ